MNGVVELLSGLLVICGSLFVLAGGIGALRMPDFYTRIHGASLTDSLGPVLVLGGLILQAGLSLVSVKLAVVLLLLMTTSPTASYALANAALLAGLRPAGEGDKAAPPETSRHEESQP
ncbi:monovalent cation/H(+) antiporter subunit G [Kineobactrum salinum]|uniref:Monovalent cation/H(+) antiporter subunit G n=1 Tax=Kineobactrum salinum TaxID=2708301 RepID=A0A6C0TXF5_9GAMM|nr:monovalent cation/H(+) antiporter subunit G [Kineobactrum salinum]QIB64089.1 monovalent cation/H(+) antiporter subunit G [Kineobactrum salinum]